MGFLNHQRQLLLTISAAFSPIMMVGAFVLPEVTDGIKDVMLAGNAYLALKDIIAISREIEWVSGSWAWFSGLFPYVKVGKLNVTA